jgi:hypothetical protein
MSTEPSTLFNVSASYTLAHGIMKQVFIESDLSSFDDFHDGQWFERLFSASEKTPFHAYIEEFAAHWWGASRAFALPRLLVVSVSDAAGGYELHGKTNE